MKPSLVVVSVSKLVVLCHCAEASFAFPCRPRRGFQHELAFDGRSSSLVDRSNDSKHSHVCGTGSALPATPVKRDIHSLEAWAADAGVKFHSNVELVSSSSSSCQEEETENDWGVSLSRTSPTDTRTLLSAGTTVLSVPDELVLSSTRVQQELEQVYNLDLQPSFQLLAECGFTNQTPEFLLVMKILVEAIAKGGQSLWQPWLASLPAHFSTGVYMNSFERSCLPPFAFALAEFSIETLQAFQRALVCLLEQDAAAADSSLSTLKALMVSNQSNESGDDYSFNNVVKWAYSIVVSRCWKYADQVNESCTSSCNVVQTDIVPLGDMFNHADPANVVVNYMEGDNSSSGTQELDNGTDSAESSNEVRFVLMQDVEVDSARGSSHQEQLCLSYGLTTNPYRFLVLFGFVNEGMKEMFCQVLFTNPSKEMVDLGCNDRARMVYGTKDGKLSNVVMDTVLYSLLEQQTGNTGAEIARNQLYQAHVDGDHKAKAAIRSKYLVEICLSLRNHVVRTLHEFDALLHKVENIKEVSGDASMVEKEYPRLAMIHRHNTFVHGVFQKVKSRLDGMIQTEMARRRRLTAEAQQQQ